MTEAAGPPRRYRPRRDVPRLIAHRGASAVAPENTIAAFEAAARLGARWVEIDAMLCGDGTPVVIHDETLERTTDGSGSVAETPLAALERLDAGRWFGPEFAGERVPTLAETIETLARLGLGANVEIKPAKGHELETGRAVADFLASRWPDTLPPPILSSFSPEALRTAYAAQPHHDYAPLFRGIPDGWQAQLDAVGGHALHCDHRRLTPERAAEVAATGAALRCYTVNDAATAARLQELGVATFFTDTVKV